MKQKYTYMFLALVLMAGTALGAFAPYARAEGDQQENNNSFHFSTQAEFHSNKIGDNNGASDASENSNATATTRMEDKGSKDQEHEQEQEQKDNNNEKDHNASSTESNDRGGSLDSNGIPTTLQGLLDFLQQLKEQVLALLAQITGRADTSLQISSVAATNLTSSGATVTWTTNQVSSGKVYVSTSTPVNISVASSTSDATLTLNHSVVFSNLSASTTYYYVVESTNANGSVERSDTFSFTTTQPQSVSVSSASVASSTITTSSATVHWTTNVAASSRVYVSTSTPVVTSSAIFTENPTLVLTHDLVVSGLSASTTYYYIAESKDANGNIAQSVQGSFTTL